MVLLDPALVCDLFDLRGSCHLTFGSEVFAVCPDLESHFVLPPPSSGARDSRLSCSTLRKAKTTRIERMQYTVLLADPIPDLDIP